MAFRFKAPLSTIMETSAASPQAKFSEVVLDKANREKELSLVGIMMVLTWTTMNTRKVVEIWTNVTAG